MGDNLRRYGSLFAVFFGGYALFVFLSSEFSFYEYKTSARFACRQTMGEHSVGNTKKDVEEELMKSLRRKGLAAKSEDIYMDISSVCSREKGCTCEYDIDAELDVYFPGLSDFGMAPQWTRTRNIAEDAVKYSFDAY